MSRQTTRLTDFLEEKRFTTRENVGKFVAKIDLIKMLRHKKRKGKIGY